MVKTATMFMMKMIHLIVCVWCRSAAESLRSTYHKSCQDLATVLRCHIEGKMWMLSSGYILQFFVPIFFSSWNLEIARLWKVI